MIHNYTKAVTYDGKCPYIQSILVKFEMPVFRCIIEAVDSGVYVTQSTGILAPQLMHNRLEYIINSRLENFKSVLELDFGIYAQAKGHMIVNYLEPGRSWLRIRAVCI